MAIAGDPSQPPDIRRAAYGQIARSTAASEPVYLDFFRATLGDARTDPTVAVTCMHALAKHGDPADALLISEQLDNEEPYTRWQAAACLQRLHDPAVVPALIRAATTDEDADTRAEATDALGQYPRRDVYDALVDTLADRSPTVSRAAHESLKLMTRHDAGTDPRDWLTYADEKGEELFVEPPPAPFTWQPYDKPRGFFARLLFLPDRTPAPQPPVGYAAPSP